MPKITQFISATSQVAVSSSASSAGSTYVEPSPIVHLDASQTSSIVTNPQTNGVLTWNNLGTLGGQMSSASGTRPTLYTTGRASGVLFANKNATTDFKSMDMGDLFPFAAGGVGQNGMTIIICATPRHQEGEQGSMIVDLGNSSTAGWGVGLRPYYGFYRGPTGVTSLTQYNAGIEHGAMTIIVVRFTFGGSAICKINGTLAATQSITGLASLSSGNIAADAARGASAGPFTLGRMSQNMTAADAGRAFNGIIHEVKIWNRAVSDADILTEESALKSKWLYVRPLEASNLKFYCDTQNPSTITFDDKFHTFGTIATTAGAYTVTGSSTEFTTDLAPGDYIEVDTGLATAQVRQVQSVQSDTLLTVTEPFTITRTTATNEYYDGTIEAITNQGSVGGSFTQATPSAQPRYGRGFDDEARNIYFDGTNHRLAHSGAAIDGVFLTDGTPWTITFVAKVYRETDNAAFFSNRSTDDAITRRSLTLHIDNAGTSGKLRTLRASVGTGSNNVYDIDAQHDLPIERFAVFSYVYTYDSETTTSRLRIFVDGEEVIDESTSVRAPSSLNPQAVLRVGTINTLSGTMAHMQMGCFMIFDRALEDVERQDFELYLAERHLHTMQKNLKYLANSPTAWYDGKDYGLLGFTRASGIGTIALNRSAGPIDIAGTGTQFLSQFPDNKDYIEIINQGIRRQLLVESAASDTSLELYAAQDFGIPAGTTFRVIQGYSGSIADKSATSDATNDVLSSPSAGNNIEYSQENGGLFGESFKPSYFFNAAAPVLTQPFALYFVLKNGIPTGDEVFFDGQSNALLFAYDHFTETLKVFAGNFVDTELYNPIRTHLYKVVFNGASSKLSIDNSQEITFDAGTDGSAGITLFADRTGLTGSNQVLGDLVIVSSAPGAILDQTIKTNLAAKHGIRYDVNALAIVGLRRWFDFTASNLMTIADDRTVQVIGDRVSGAPATAPAESNQPLLLENDIGSFGALQFNGVNSMVQIQSGTNSFTKLHDGTGAAIVIVASLSNHSSEQTLFATATNNAGTGIRLYYTSGMWRVDVSNGNVSYVARASVSGYNDGAVYCFRVQYKNDSASDDLELYVDGDRVAMSGTTGTPDTGDSELLPTIGSTSDEVHPLSGKVYEVLYLDKFPDSTQISRLNTYITARYSGVISGA